jgi:large subunit ribosomal protein L17
MLANMATSLFLNGHVKTTIQKAKRVRPLAERLITFAKKGDLSSRRRVLRVVRDKAVVHQLFTSIAETMKQREGGYTRITRIAPRQGDNAAMAIIELVTEPLSAKKATVREAEAATKSAAEAKAEVDAEVKAEEAKVMDEAVDAAIVEGAAQDAVEEAVEANETGDDVANADEAAVDLEGAAQDADADEAQAQEDADVAQEAEEAEEEEK